MFHVDQSTISRLRSRKIERVARYAALLRANGHLEAEGEDGLEAAISGLVSLARISPAVAALLCVLHNALRDRKSDRPAGR